MVMMICSGSLVFSQAAGNKRYVAVQTAALKDSTGFFAKELGNFPLGTELTVIREDGKWTEVRAGNLTGWMASSSLSVRRVIASTSNVTASEVALAGKGFSPDVEIEYRKNGLDYTAVNSMENLTIPKEEVLKFINDGRLSKGE